MMKFAVKEWAELISGPISMKEQDQRVFKDTDLPVVNDKLSITLRLKIHNHGSGWVTIFHKGDWNYDVGISSLGDGLTLNRWYHITYTISDPEKRLDIYIDGEWEGYYCIQNVKTQKVVFNDGPLHIGRSFNWKGFNGEISHVRYFNWRLSPEEVIEDFFNESQKKPIVYGSKIALVHVSTGKYLSTNGVKYDLGSQNKQYMVICSDEKTNLENEVWTIIGASGKSINEGIPVSLNSIVGFKHKATECNLHSHDTNQGKFTPISKQQQVTICPGGGNIDDEWLIRRYNPITSYDTGQLMNGDIIGLFHIRTNKSALYSHMVLLGDGSQEVSCYGNGSESNNKWRIELIN
ncbi:hypothetical protein RhiirA5_400356 [Rhizophagus irregularis]|nr:hypothetical protein RhiirA5_400356 [Rhizophagus irregularis]